MATYSLQRTTEHFKRQSIFCHQEEFGNCFGLLFFLVFDKSMGWYPQMSGFPYDAPMGFPAEMI